MFGGFLLISTSARLLHYKREDIREAMAAYAANREIGILYGEQGFGKRPDILSYPQDILNLAVSGATSFHCSEERWSNPAQLSPFLKRQELDTLRIGWDLVLDIDCPILDYSAIAADVLIHALIYHGISAPFVKFSGNHGFHIIVPYESFPTEIHGKPVKDLFPEGPRIIAAHLKEMIKPHIATRLLEFEPLHSIAQRLNKPTECFIKNNEFNPDTVFTIDTILIASRHLYRMPYSFNEKSGLVSIPLKPKELLMFDKRRAMPENVVVESVKLTFESGEAKRLFLQAFDTQAPQTTITTLPKAPTLYTSQQNSDVIGPIPEKYFPPCIKLISQGLEDGKKRALFILTNFLKSVGWEPAAIEMYVRDWNAKNREPLRENNIIGHLRDHVPMTKKAILPPNCPDYTNAQYYKDLGVCKPDGFCAKIKNPANYAILRQKLAVNEKGLRKKKEEKRGEKKEEKTEEKKEGVVKE